MNQPEDQVGRADLPDPNAPVTHQDLADARVEFQAQHVDLVNVVKATESLKAIQASATKWQATITTVLGLLGLGSILGRDSIQALDPGNQHFVVGGLVVSIITAAIAFFFVTRSAAGLPALVTLRDEAKNDRRRAVTGDATQKAVGATGDLQVSLFWAAVSLCAAIFAVAILWGSPDASKPSKVQVTVKEADTNTASYCTVLTEDSTGTITIKPGVGGAASSTLTQNEVVSIGPC